jgi:5'-nucleotidase/UDP-sugar diphosphatase
VDLWSDGTYAGPKLTKLVQGYENAVLDEFGVQIGTAAQDLTKGRGESNLGNWLADTFRANAGADVAFINSGGIRKTLRAGPVTALDIHEILPFANNLVTVELTDRQLAAIVQQNADNSVSRKHGILQVSGIRYTFGKAPGGETAEVQEILVGGQPLKASGVYRVAMPDYVAMMADVYLNVDLPATTDLGVTLATVVVAEVEKSGNIDAKIDGRIQKVK